MPADTRNKRASVIGVNLPAPRLEQNPSGTIGALGRQFAAFCYVGILAAIPSTPLATSFKTWNTEPTTVTSYNVEPTTLLTWNPV